MRGALGIERVKEGVSMDDNIGEILRHTRLERGVSLEQIETDTKISKRYILNLENEEWAKLPGRVYIKGFLKTYSSYLGLNEQAILDRFEVDVIPAPAFPSVPLKPRRNIELTVKPKRRTIVLMSVLAICFLAVVQFGYHWWVVPNRERQPSPPVTEPTSPSESVGTPTASADLITQPPITSIAMELTVLQEECWIQIKGDGAVLYEKTMRAGESVDFDDITRLELVAGNPSVVELKLNGEPYVVGERGTVGRKTYIFENGELKEEVRR
jgi:cytoskeletal protein RodZ